MMEMYIFTSHRKGTNRLTRPKYTSSPNGRENTSVSTKINKVCKKPSASSPSIVGIVMAPSPFLC